MCTIKVEYERENVLILHTHIRSVFNSIIFPSRSITIELKITRSKATVEVKMRSSYFNDYTISSHPWPTLITRPDRLHFYVQTLIDSKKVSVCDVKNEKFYVQTLIDSKKVSVCDVKNENF